jgi:hypothetical protein
MTEQQKRRRAVLEARHGRADPRGIERGVEQALRLAARTPQPLVVRSDEHADYPRALRRLHGYAIRHECTSSLQARTAGNPLFPVNRVDLLMRHNSANHKRETIAFSKRHQGVVDRALWLVLWQNFAKPFSERRGGPTPAMRLGLDPRAVPLLELLRTRWFASRIPLPELLQRYHRGEVPTPALQPRAPVHELLGPLARPTRSAGAPPYLEFARDHHNLRRTTQSKRQPVVELPRLRLPLPERTGSDRDELLSPHGFVDRAYSVFLLRCVSLLRTDSLHLPGYGRCVHPPLGPAYSPEAGSHLRALLLRRVNEGTSPWAHPRPLLLRLRYDVPCLERPAGICLDGGPEGRAPMEVPDLRASRPNDEIPLPPRDLQPPGLATRVASQPVSAALL